VLEVPLGLPCRALGWHIAPPVFDGATYEEILDHLELAEKKMSAPEDENDPHVNEFHFHNGKPLSNVVKKRNPLLAGRGYSGQFLVFALCQFIPLGISHI
jgi:DNA-directed RNA polymerase subunit beta